MSRSKNGAGSNSERSCAKSLTPESELTTNSDLKNNATEIETQDRTLRCSDDPTIPHLFQLTLAEKGGNGVISKRIELIDGKSVSDGSCCWMSRGYMERVFVPSLQAFADFLEDLNSFGERGKRCWTPDQKRPNDRAIILGSLRDGIGKGGRVVSKNDPEAATGQCLTRTKEHVFYQPGRPALALLDFDRKGMTNTVRERLNQLGGFSSAIEFLCPELVRSGYVIRKSTSSGLWNEETGERYPSGGGVHCYVLCQDGGDIARFLKVMHRRAWLNGLGWHIVSKCGALLERSILDVAVASGERLVFEGDPQLVPPLRQDRRPVQVHEGPELDTVMACIDLCADEQREFDRLIAASKTSLDHECAETRKAWEAARIEEMIARGVDEAVARETMKSWGDNELLPDVMLPFADPALKGRTVADVLAEPEKFIGAQLADPVEGVDLVAQPLTCKVMV